VDKLNSLQIIRNVADNYNSIAKHFSDTRNRAWPEFEYFKQYIQNNQNILDWGCGNGRLLNFLKDFNINYYGVDISNKLIETAKEKHKDLIKNKKAYFYSTYDKNKEFDNNFFDSVFMIASLNHLPTIDDRIKILKQIHSEMKETGKLMITVWNLDSTWFQSKKEFEKTGDNDYLIYWKDQNSKIQAKLYYHNFSKNELSSLLEEAGFKVSICQYFDNEFIDDKKQARNLVAVAEK